MLLVLIPSGLAVSDLIKNGVIEVNATGLNVLGFVNTTGDIKTATGNIDIRAGALLIAGTSTISSGRVGSFATGTQVNSQNICLADGTNCPAVTGSGWVNTSGGGNVSLANPNVNVSANTLFIDNSNAVVNIGGFDSDTTLYVNHTYTSGSDYSLYVNSLVDYTATGFSGNVGFFSRMVAGANADRNDNTYTVWAGRFSTEFTHGANVSSMVASYNDISLKHTSGTERSPGNVYGTYTTVNNAENGTVDSYYAQFASNSNKNGTVTNQYGMYSRAYTTGANAATTNAYGLYTQVFENAGAITTGYSLRASCSGPATCYGLYLNDIAGATTSYSIYSTGSDDIAYFEGNIRAGSGTPGYATGAGDIYATSDMEYDGNLYGPGADLAELIHAAELLVAGDVVEIDPLADETVRKSTLAYSTRVIGVVSTDPGIILSKERGDVPLAISGRVPVKVTTENGPILRGDLLTTSSTPGRAMRCADLELCRGALIGKALGVLTSGEGTIPMIVLLG